MFILYNNIYLKRSESLKNIYDGLYLNLKCFVGKNLMISYVCRLSRYELRNKVNKTTKLYDLVLV